jgi:hypothetical protein
MPSRCRLFLWLRSSASSARTRTGATTPPALVLAPWRRSRRASLRPARTSRRGRPRSEQSRPVTPERTTARRGPCCCAFASGALVVLLRGPLAPHTVGRRRLRRGACLFVFVCVLFLRRLTGSAGWVQCSRRSSASRRFIRPTTSPPSPRHQYSPPSPRRQYSTPTSACSLSLRPHAGLPCVRVCMRVFVCVCVCVCVRVCVCVLSPYIPTDPTTPAGLHLRGESPGSSVRLLQ